MQTIDLVPGTSIEEAARDLCTAAPARAMFNGIPLRARYATTCPRDIVRQYWWNLEIRSIAWRNSPAGKAAKKADDDVRADAQCTVDACVARLPALDMSDASAVLAWVKQIAMATDYVGLVYDHDATVAAFDAAGWRSGMNCGDDFNEADADNFAHWIVGQWFASRHPLAVQFIDDWRKKFTVS